MRHTQWHHRPGPSAIVPCGKGACATEFALAVAAAITCHLCVEDNMPLWMPFPQQIHHGTPPSRVPGHDDKQRRPLSVTKGAVTACCCRALRTSVLPRCQNTLVRLSYLYGTPQASPA